MAKIDVTIRNDTGQRVLINDNVVSSHGQKTFSVAGIYREYRVKVSALVMVTNNVTRQTGSEWRIVINSTVRISPLGRNTFSVTGNGAVLVLGTR